MMLTTEGYNGFIMVEQEMAEFNICYYLFEVLQIDPDIEQVVTSEKAHYKLIYAAYSHTF